MPEYKLKRPTINGRATLVWYVVWSEGRRSCRLSTKATDKRVAEKFLAQFVAAENAPPEDFTIGDLCDGYLKIKEEDPTIKYPKAIRNSLKHIKAHFGALPPSLLSRATVRGYITQRRKLVMDSTIDKELRFLRQALKFGVNEKWMKDEPKIETPGGSAPRQRFLSRLEFATIFHAASPLHLRTFLALAVDTLARGKAVLALTWDRVDFERRIIWYAPQDPRSKKRAVQVPMTDRLHNILLRASEAAITPRVIEWNGKPVKSVRKAYERACRVAGIDDAHRHDLRRTGASWAIQGGSSFTQVAAMLGDTEEVTIAHYAMFHPTYLKGVAESIESGSGGRRA